MVECLIPSSGPTTYRYIDNRLGIDEMRYHYTAGRKFFCVVPNRVAATLLPIIFTYCKPGSIIRSDGWSAYRGLHDRDIQERYVSSDSFSFGANHDLFFHAHQVVNHSEGFATVDQVDSNPEVSQVPVSGLIHSNMIESMWTQLKDYLSPRHRTYKQALGKILEYLWLTENHSDVMGGLYRMFREVKFPGRQQEDSDEENEIEEHEEEEVNEPMFFTQAPNGETLREQEIRSARDRQHFEAWIARRRAERSEAVGSDGEDEEEVNSASRHEDNNRSSAISANTPSASRRGRPRGRVSRGRGRLRTRSH